MRPSSAPGFFPEFVEGLLISKHGHSVYRVCTSITDHGLPVQTSKAELARHTGVIYPGYLRLTLRQHCKLHHSLFSRDYVVTLRVNPNRRQRGLAS